MCVSRNGEGLYLEKREKTMCVSRNGKGLYPDNERKQCVLGGMTNVTNNVIIQEL